MGVGEVGGQADHFGRDYWACSYQKLPRCFSLDLACSNPPPLSLVPLSCQPELSSPLTSKVQSSLLAQLTFYLINPWANWGIVLECPGMS